MFSGKDIYEGYGSNTTCEIIETIQGIIYTPPRPSFVFSSFSLLNIDVFF